MSAGNSYKIKKGKSGGFSIFSILENGIRLDRLFREGLPARYLPHLIFITALGILYIGNNHWVERSVRNIDRLQVEVEEYRADYTSLKAEYMFAGKQSEVARKVKSMGLQESLEPPQKIIVKEDEY
jgi:hypothetical protein